MGPAGAMPAIAIFTSTSASNSTSPKSVTATCGGATTRAVGGGAIVTNPGTPVALTASYPASNAIWTVSAVETNHYSPSWSITAYVICV